MIIHSTVLNTMEKVVGIYGGITWIQHSGYVLRGATSGVVANSSTKTGGNDNAIVPKHTHTFTGQEVATGAMSGNSTGSHYAVSYQNPSCTGNFKGSDSGNLTCNAGTGYTNSKYTINVAHTHKVTAKGTNSETGEDVTNKNIPNYKSVYIWERTA